jgi:hypothetical protein
MTTTRPVPHIVIRPATIGFPCVPLTAGVRVTHTLDRIRVTGGREWSRRYMYALARRTWRSIT